MISCYSYHTVTPDGRLNKKRALHMCTCICMMCWGVGESASLEPLAALAALSLEAADSKKETAADSKVHDVVSCARASRGAGGAEEP